MVATRRFSPRQARCRGNLYGCAAVHHRCLYAFPGDLNLANVSRLPVNLREGNASDNGG